MMKHGRKGKPKMHYFRVTDNDTQLSWRSANGSQRSVPLRNVNQVVKCTFVDRNLYFKDRSKGLYQQVHLYLECIGDF